MRYGRVIGALLAVTLGACGQVENEDADAIDFPDGKTDSITPQGDLGYLIVKEADLPAGVTKVPYQVSYRGVNLEIGKKYRLKKGNGTLSLTAGNVRDREVPLTIEAKKTVTHVLPFVVVSWDPSLLETDVGPKPLIVFQEREYNMTMHSIYLDGTAPSSRAFPFLGGSYSVTLTPRVLGAAVLKGTGSTPHTTEISLPQNTVKTIEVNKDVRSKVTFRSPVREAGTPDGVKRCLQVSSGVFADCQLNHHWVLWKSSPSSGSYEPSYQASEVGKVGADGRYPSNSFYGQQYILNLHHFTLPADGTVTVRMFQLSSSDPSQTYLYVVNNVPWFFNPPPGDSFIEGQHLDVFDAEVEENGAVTSYPAKYRVEWLCPNGTAYGWCGSPGGYTPIYLVTEPISGQPGRVAAPFQFQSPSGLDLPPNTYRVTVNFTTDVGPLVRTYQCDLIGKSQAGEARCKLVSEQ